MKFFFVLFLAIPMLVFSQNTIQTKGISIDHDFQNIYSLKLADDSLQTTFLICIKKNVAEHYHQTHTENIYVIEGKADMSINGIEQRIRKGDYLNIPMGTKHAVTKVPSRKPLKVLSIQSPQFDGTDRIIIKEPNCDF